MKFRILACVFLAVSASGQRLEHHYLQSPVLPSQVVPPVSDAETWATVNILVLLARDASGQVVSGAVDYVAAVRTAGIVQITRIRLHEGAAGQTGPGRIDLNLTNLVGAPRVNRVGSFGFSPVITTEREQLAALERMVRSPNEYYVVLHTEAQPEGALRGQLERAEKTVLMALVSSQQVVPPVTDVESSAIQSFEFWTTRNAAGKLTSAYLQSVSTYRFPRPTLTAHGIHEGPAGTNGEAFISTETPIQNLPRPGLSVIAPWTIDLRDPAQAATMERLLSNPGNFYLSLSTQTHRSGVLRGQLRFADEMVFRLIPRSSVIVPGVPGVSAEGVATLLLNTLREEDGAVAGGLLSLFTSVRFPGRVELANLSVSEGALGANGPVAVGIFDFPGTPPPSYRHESGVGFQIASPVLFAPDSGELREAVDRLVNSPENYYLTIGTTEHRGGALRAQMGTGAPPAIQAVANAALNGGAPASAPGGLITIYGANLAKVAAGLQGWHGSLVPRTLNNAIVEVAGRRAPLLYVSPAQINAQVPFDVPLGLQTVAVHNGTAPSEARTIAIHPTTPSPFVSRTGAVIMKESDSTQVGPANPAVAGEVLSIYSTGLGQTTPLLSTGRVVPSGTPFRTGTVEVTVGTQAAELLDSTAAPGLPGVYRTRIRMPPGVPAGKQPLVLRLGGNASSPVELNVR